MIFIGVSVGGVIVGRFVLRFAMSSCDFDEVAYFLLDGFVLLVLLFIFRAISFFLFGI